MAITNERLERMKRLADWVSNNNSQNRRDSLEAFAKSNSISYETAKEDMTVLGYAVTPGFDLRSVPKTRRNEAKALMEKINEGNLDRVKTGASVYDFIMKTPVSDAERMNRIHTLTEPQDLILQKRVAELMQKLAEEKVKRGVHPVLAQAATWREAGKKMHFEIETVKKEVKPEMLDNVVRSIWEANFLKLQAQVQYEKANRKIVNEIKYQRSSPEKGETMPIYFKKLMIEKYGPAKAESMSPEKMKQEMDSLLKSTARNILPGKERMTPPKNIRRALERIAGQKGFYAMGEAGQNLKAGRTTYRAFKEKEKELPKSIWSGKRALNKKIR